MSSISKSLVVITILIAVQSIHMEFNSGTIIPRNRLTFERVQCISNPNGVVKLNKCIAKLISRDHIRVDMAATLNSTINSVFAHYAAFKQFSTNEYRQFVFNGWEDFCGYMKGDNRNIFISMLYPKFVQYTNVNHTCPYMPGVYFINIYNLSINWFAAGYLMPAGRFRLEISAHEGFKGPMLGKVKVFGSVSDHRVEQF